MASAIVFFFGFFFILALAETDEKKSAGCNYPT